MKKILTVKLNYRSPQNGFELKKEITLEQYCKLYLALLKESKGIQSIQNDFQRKLAIEFDNEISDESLFPDLVVRESVEKGNEFVKIPNYVPVKTREQLEGDRAIGGIPPIALCGRLLL